MILWLLAAACNFMAFLYFASTSGYSIETEIHIVATFGSMLMYEIEEHKSWR